MLGGELNIEFLLLAFWKVLYNVLFLFDSGEKVNRLLRRLVWV